VTGNAAPPQERAWMAERFPSAASKTGATAER
jgi:hypothetical protein